MVLFNSPNPAALRRPQFEGGAHWVRCSPLMCLVYLSSQAQSTVYHAASLVRADTFFFLF